MTRRWAFVGRLTNRSSTHLAPLVVAGGKLQAWLYQRSGGRLAKRFFGVRIFVLEVVGRKSGQLRRIPLFYVEVGGRWAVLAANGGNAKPPAWWLNLRAAGRGTAVFGRRRVDVTAREATAEEHDRLWPLLVANYPPVEAYLEFTTRRIPIVVLEPARSPRSPGPSSGRAAGAAPAAPPARGRSAP